jgi:L-2-hydroxycarboxylate dehydrogenase (NAD+)
MHQPQDAPGTIRIPVDQLRAFVEEVFTALGVPGEDARICQDVLVSSDLRGIDSHGVGRLIMYYERMHEGIQHAKTELEIVGDREATATIDGHNGMGHVISYRAMEMAIEKARRYGLGAVAVRNSTHYGFAGYYPLMAARQDMMGLTVTNARPSVPPTFGVEPLLGTNPITFAAPSDLPYPFIIDAATSIAQRGKLEHMVRQGKPAPEGWAINRQGEPQTETRRLLDDLLNRSAALLPLGGADETLGGHKGFGYSTMVEILSSALQDGSFMTGLLGFDDEGNRQPYHLGHFFLAIDIAHFVDPSVAKAITGSIMRRLQGAERMPGHNRIWVAGEKEYETEQFRLAHGIPANENLLKKLRAMRDHLKLEGYEAFGPAE